MKPPRSPKSHRRFRCDPLDRRLAAYATAGKAFVAVGAAVGAAGAHAQIIPINTLVFRNQTTYFGPDVTITAAIQHQLVAPLFHTLYSGHPVGAKAGAWSVYHTQRATWGGALGFAYHQGFYTAQFQFAFNGTARRPLSAFFGYDKVSRLNHGDAIAGRNFAGVNDPFLLAYHPFGGGALVGNFAGHSNQTGYLGFKLSFASRLYYGWMRVRVTNNADGTPTSLVFFAQNQIYGALAPAGSVNGGNITAGQTSITAIPEPASVAGGLALFALGAAGVREYRRRRKAAA